MVLSQNVFQVIARVIINPAAALNALAVFWKRLESCTQMCHALWTRWDADAVRGLIQNSASRNCQVEEKNVVEGARDHKGCPVCQCVCPPFSVGSCKAECDAYKKVPIPGVTSPYECLLCQCACPSLDTDICQTLCEAQGRTMLAGATNLYGCPDCQCIGKYVNYILQNGNVHRKIKTT